MKYAYCPVCAIYMIETSLLGLGSIKHINMDKRSAIDDSTNQGIKVLKMH